MVLLVFEKSCKGLMMRIRRRLRLLGWECCVSPYVHDFQIEEYVKKLNEDRLVVLVTYDRDLADKLGDYGVWVPFKYEEAATKLIRHVARVLRAKGGGEMCRGSQVHPLAAPESISPVRI